MKKRTVIVATSILIATLSVSSITYAVNKNHTNKVNDAKLELKDEIMTLNSIRTELDSYIDKDGFLQEGLTLEKVKELKKSLNSIKDDYKDLGINKDDLNNKIKVVKSDKKSLKKDNAIIESKLELQNEVNGLFENVAITGTTVTVKPIIDAVTMERVIEVKGKVEKETSKWGMEINELVLEAENQLKQIETATNIVNPLFVDGEVDPNVTVARYNEVKVEVDKILNEKFKVELTNKLNAVFVIAEENQKKAEEEELAQQQAHQAKRQASQGSNTTNSGVSSGSKSNSTSKSSGSTGGTISGGGTTSSGGKVITGTKTGEGEIDTDGIKGEKGASTWESFEFEWSE